MTIPSRCAPSKMVAEPPLPPRRTVLYDSPRPPPRNLNGRRFMQPSNRTLLSLVVTTFWPAIAAAQTFRSADSVIRKMWQVGMEQSQTEKLAQVLIDSIGPRLSGTAGFQSAVDWLDRTYQGWGVP